MIKPPEQTGFLIETTQDGSPTLRLSKDGESMHHSGGAAAETRLIYATVIERAHALLKARCQTLIVGLGLGYIEIAWAQSLLKLKLKPSHQLAFHSFETLSQLRADFSAWPAAQGKMLYDEISRKLDANIDVTDVKQLLQTALSSSSAINENIENFESINIQFNVICYDAFSRKTNENLWREDFLNRFLEKAAASDCAFTTYASTTTLKKALLKNNFTLLERLGFNGKRESTLAVRGKFLNQS